MTDQEKRESITSQQLHDIYSGVFRGIEEGDYCYINGIKYVAVRKDEPSGFAGCGDYSIVFKEAVTQNDDSAHD